MQIFGDLDAVSVKGPSTENNLHVPRRIWILNKDCFQEIRIVFINKLSFISPFAGAIFVL